MLIDFPLFCLAGIIGISLVGDSLKTVAVTSMLMTRCLGQSNYEEAVRGCANENNIHVVNHSQLVEICLFVHATF